LGYRIGVFLLARAVDAVDGWNFNDGHALLAAPVLYKSIKKIE